MEQPCLQQVSLQAVYDLLRHNNKLVSIVSELMDIMLTGKDQSQADQPNSLAEGPPIQICESAVETIHTSTKEKRVPRAEAPGGGLLGARRRRRTGEGESE
eukprot:269905-Pelagomonas_calceolata.AAC.1